MNDAFKKIYQSSFRLLMSISKLLLKNLPLKGLLRIRNILILVLIYFAIVVFIILTYIEIPYNYNKGAVTMALYGTQNRIGESLLYDRLKVAAKKNGWNVIGVCLPEKFGSHFIATRHFYVFAENIVNWFYKPKFNLHTTHFVNTTPYGYNIMYMNIPYDSIINPKGNFETSVEHLAYYDAYIDINSILHGTNPKLLHALYLHGNEKAPILPIYFAQHYVPYSPSKREQLLVVGSLWGCNRCSLRIFNVLQKLATENMLVAYGHKYAFELLGSAYKGRIEEHTGKNSEKVNSLFNIQKKYGISLVLHNLDHIIDGIPTNRIVESVAAGSIVISDNHPFIKKYFGNTVLYFDAFAQPDEMYDQIRNHVQWIRNNPEEAEKKAKAAYDIFNEHFTMEKALHKVNDFVDKNGSIA